MILLLDFLRFFFLSINSVGKLPHFLGLHNHLIEDKGLDVETVDDQREVRILFVCVSRRPRRRLLRSLKLDLREDNEIHPSI